MSYDCSPVYTYGYIFIGLYAYVFESVYILTIETVNSKLTESYTVAILLQIKVV